MSSLPIHMEFRQLQDTKPYVEGFIDTESRLLALDCAEVLAVDARVHELRLRHQTPELLFVRDQRDGGTVLLILAGFGKHTVVHQLEHLLLERCCRLLSHLLVDGDVGCLPGALMVLDTSVDLAEDLSMLDIELKQAEVDHVLPLVH